MKGKRIRLAVVVLSALLAIGCGPGESPWLSTDIRGFMPDLRFDLIDGEGRETVAEDFRGKTLLIYFGFASCPHICPTALRTLVSAVRESGAPPERVRVLFVSVDPRRDAPRLKEYSGRFGPEVVGLTGDLSALKDLAKRYRVAFGYGEPDANGNYSVDHSTGVFAFDSAGRARLLMREESGVPALAADIRRLVDEPETETRWVRK